MARKLACVLNHFRVKFMQTRLRPTTARRDHTPETKETIDMWSWSKISKNGRSNGLPGRDSLANRADLQIRNLLDDPGLRRAMRLDVSPDSTELAVVPAGPKVTERPRRPFDRRRLLEAAAA
jgi:hypothetical protein